MTTAAGKRVRKLDAKNRSLRVLLVNLSIDVVVAVVLVLWTTFDKANSWGDIEWGLLGFSLLKSAVAALGAFVLRYFLDPSGLPTPLPPPSSGLPNTLLSKPGTQEEAGVNSIGLVLAVLLAVVVVVIVLRVHNGG